MFENVIKPRFCETDAIGHVGNTTFPIWFEESRDDLFKLIHPSLEAKTWPLILARQSIDFVAQCYMEELVKVETYLSKLGNSSMTVTHVARQDCRVVAKAECIMVYFDYATNKSKPFPDNIRILLSAHLREDTDE